MILSSAATITLLHAGQLTWDELLFLAFGLGLLFLIGFLGQRTNKEPVSGIALGVSKTNEQQLPARQALSIKDVSHRYGRTWALADVSLAVDVGQRISILGPNGAGKSTLLKILATLLQPTSGDVIIGNASLKLDPLNIRKQVGFVSHQSLLYPSLTVLENLHFFGQIYDVEGWKQRAKSLLHQVQLWNKRHASVESLSQGQRQRIALARALLHNPDILLLDEPYAGLDLQASERLDHILDQLSAQGHTLFMTTHDLQRSHNQSDWIVILAEGRVVFHTQSQFINYDDLEQTYRAVLVEFGDDD